MHTPAPALLIDTYSLFFRSFYGLPRMTTSYGQPTSALYGLCTLLLKLMREQRPGGLCFALDSPGRTVRHDVYPQYKAGRPTLPDDLGAQFGLLRELIATLGVPSFSVAGIEADDILASLAHKLEPERPVLIATGDRDLLQRVRPRVQVVFLGARGKPAQLYDVAAVEARFGIPPQRLPAYVALIGDSSDNIPGIAGVGERTARALIAEHPSIDALLTGLPRLAKPALRATLDAQRAELLRNEALVRLREDVELGAGPYCAAVPSERMPALRELFARLEFRSLATRLDQLQVPDR